MRLVKVKVGGDNGLSDFPIYASGLKSVVWPIDQMDVGV